MTQHDSRNVKEIWAVYNSGIVAHVLAEAKGDDSRGRLSVDQIRSRAGLGRGRRVNGIIRGVLSQMYLFREVDYTCEGEEGWVWWLRPDPGTGTGRRGPRPRLRQ